LDTEYKASMEMCFHIVRVFLAFSNFLEMHPLLGQYKAGALTMKVRGGGVRVALTEEG
jgi:hypothetical protein